MRLLHTSDWHLGQSLHNFERTYEHDCFLEWLLETLVAEAADGLLIAGDVFDNANPSAASQKQFYRFLQQAKTRLPHLNIIVIAGNHDSPGRLEAPAPLLEGLDISVVGNVPRLDNNEIDVSRLVLPLKARDGSVAAWCLAVPFLRPGDVPRIDTDGDPYMEGIALLYRQALTTALVRRQPGQAIIALGHCHMTGGEVSTDSERRIVVGGAEAVPAGVFAEDIAYVGLGHLHKAQRVGQQARIRYSGSPLPMSFAEVDYAHQILRVDIDGESLQQVSDIRIPRTVPLLRVPRQAAALDDVLAALDALNLAPAADERARPYLEVRVRLDAPEPGLRARIEAALGDKPVRLARIDAVSAARATDAAAPLSLDDLGRLQPDDIFKRLYQQRFGCEAPTEQIAAFAELALGPLDQAA